MITQDSARTRNGGRISLFTLDNGQATVVLTDLGARILEIHVPDRSGRTADVVLGRATIDQLLGDDTYMGATAGRYANRIRNGRFTLDDRQYQVTCNEGSNSVHGGNRGFDQYVWTSHVDSDSHSITFTRTSPDGEEGFPGNLAIQVSYTLTGTTLDITIVATTDQPTLANIVNHAYFNMAGHASGTVLDQLLQLKSTFYTPVDDDLLPTGEVLAVQGTPFDFQEPTPIGKNIKAVENAGAGRSTDGGTGYDHNWVLGGHGFREVASLTDSESGRRLVLWTDQPGVQVYVGGYLQGETGKAPLNEYDAFAGLTLETQTFPDSPNVPHFPQRVLRPGEVYRNRIKYEFSVVRA